MMLTRSALLTVAAIALALVFVWSLQLAPVTQANAPYAIVQLTNDRASNVRPAWSPDNRMVAYQSNRDSDAYHIYVMNVDGTNQRALTRGANDDRHPVWMPDGKSLLFDSSSDGVRREIWMANVADGSMKQITRMGAFANFAAPSPDGQYLTFYLFKADVLDLWKARIDGTEAQPLTTGLASANKNQCTFACHQAGWSADGKMVAYSAGELDAIWTVASDGSNTKRVIDNGEDNHFPWFLPDGRLGYITQHVQPAGKAWTDLWAYDLDRGESSLLHGQMALQGPLEWSNDGSKVLFHSPRAGTFEIYMIDLTAPDGQAALEGGSVSPEQMKSSASTTTSVPAAVLAAPMPYLALGLGLGLVAVTVTVGVGLVIRFKKPFRN